MRDIDLLIGLVKSKKQFDMKKTGKTFALATLLLAVILGAAFGALTYLSGTNRDKIDELRTEMMTYNEVNKIKNDIVSANQQYDSIRQLIDMTSNGSLISTDFLDLVSSSMNDAIFLTSLTISEDRIVGITGKAATRIDITYFIYALKMTEAFSEVSVNSINTEVQQNSEEPTAFNFSVTAVLKEAASIE